MGFNTRVSSHPFTNNQIKSFRRRRVDVYKQSTLLLHSSSPFDIMDGICDVSFNSITCLTNADAMAAATTTTSTAVYEAQLNLPAFASVFIITVIFSALQLRINAIRNAATRRKDALKSLRELRSQQLSSSSSIPIENEAVDLIQRVHDAKCAYEDALHEEMNLRSVASGVRIAVVPNDPQRMEDQIAAAKQFLNLDLSDYDDNHHNHEQKRRRWDEHEMGGFSNMAKAILLTVALSQMALLWMLSVDSMTATQMLMTIGGKF